MIKRITLIKWVPTTEKNEILWSEYRTFNPS